MAISNEVFKNTIHHSVNRNTSAEEAASLISEGIKKQCAIDPEKNSWLPKRSELQQLPVPDSLKLCFQSLLATTRYFRCCMISSVTNRSILTAKHFLFATGLYSITGMKQIIQILHKMGHCMSYNKTSEIETAITETKQSNVLPSLPIGEETVLTYSWAEKKWKNGQHDATCGVPSVEYQPNEFPDPAISKYQEPPKFSEIKHRAYIAAQFNSLFFIWLCFRKWNSHDQAVPQ